MVTADRRLGEQSRARYPDREGWVERDGVRVHYEACGAGEPAILLLPAWSIVHSRAWKLQIPFLARRTRVVTFDPRGNGLSSRPKDASRYAESEFAADALAVLDALDVERAFLVSHSMGAQRALILSTTHPERVAAAIFISPAVPLGAQTKRAEAIADFDRELPEYVGWSKYNRHYWHENYAEFVEFFGTRVFTEPHSTKQIEDMLGYGLDTDPDALVASALCPGLDEAEVRRLAEQLACPTLVVHGTDDEIRAPESGRQLAELLGAPFILLEGTGHAPHARDPVLINRLIDEFFSLPHAR